MKLQLKSGYWDVREKQTNGQTLLSIYEKNLIVKAEEATVVT